MQRSWVWVIALGTGLIAANPACVVRAATRLSGPQNLSGSEMAHSGPLIEIAQGHHPGGGGGGRGPGGPGGGGSHGPINGGGAPHGPVGGGAFVHSSGGPPGGAAPHGSVGFVRRGGGPSGGGGPHIIAPGGAGPHLVAPHVGTGSHVLTLGHGPRIVTHRYGQRAPSVVQRMRRVTPRPRIMAHSGAHYPRYRRRHGRFRYYYGGWWYAYPWWTYYGTSCTYRARECAYRWGWRTRRYYACLRYYGCY
jgi:hypothetical protein